MDISQFQKLSNSKIEAGRTIRAVRNDLKEYKEAKQDAYEGLSETYKPIIDVQQSIQKRNDERQDELIDQLQRNQQALTQVIDANQKAIIFDTELPKAIEGDERGPTLLNVDNIFNRDDRIILKNNELLPPKDLTQVSLNKLQEERLKSVDIAKAIGRNKRYASPDVRASYDLELDTLRKYRKTIDDVINSWKYRTTKGQKGSGIYTQKKRNAYKIDQNGQYGGLIIDLPKLYGHLKVIAHKNGPEGLVKVYDKQADFDTLDLLTKRFNSKKKYSDLSKKIFDELNQISGIPIHRTSSKFKKIGQGVIYYNNPNDLLDRMELLGGSILAGNDGVKKEFTQIAHTLNKIGVINNNQLNNLIKEYII